MDPIRAEAIRTLYIQLRTSAAAAMIVTSYMIGTAAPYTRATTIMAWAGAQAVTQAVRLLLFQRYREERPDGPALERWAHAYTAYMATAGLVWGSTIFLFAHLSAPITVALTLCGLYGISAGSVPGNAYNPPGLYAFVGLIFGAVLVRLCATSAFAYVILGLASAGFALIMIGFCRVQARTIADGFRIRFENRELLAALEHRTAEAEEARHRAESASLAKSQFLAAASHDLRQPLYALSLFSTSLRELRLDAASEAVVGDIERSVTALEQLFDGLLDISRLEAGVIEPRLVSVSVNALFDRLSQYHRPLACERGIDLRFRSNGEHVRSDPALLEQVLSNLLSNAVRYTTNGAVLVAARRRESRLRFEVWDTGIGIADEDRHRVFEEFVQVGNSERDRRKGLGLGLPIGRRAAALVGAKIEIVSRIGRGSRFAFDQPLDQAGDLPVVMRQNGALTTRPVLIVEDDNEVRRGLAGLFRQWVIDADLVANAEEALTRVVDQTDYGLLIADHRLPGALDGLALIQRVRAMRPAIQVALVTADVDSALVAACARANVPLLYKPLRAEVLRELLAVRNP